MAKKILASIQRKNGREVYVNAWHYEIDLRVPQ